MYTLKLVLEDGTVIRGRSFGAQREVAGEVVFNTGMSGYVETLTDASYRGQILVTTYPLQGNYGVPAPRPRGSIDAPYESDRIQVQGMVCVQHTARPSHHACTRSLGDWLRGENVPGLEMADTRTLTRKLREHGTMAGCLLFDDTPVPLGRARADRVEMEKVVSLVTVPEPVIYEAGPLCIVLVDTGCKDNIARSLQARGATVLRVPFTADLRQYASRADGVLLSNGPGDPKDLPGLAAQVRSLFDLGKPVFGVCLGNQILALAAGGDTYKLKYGHRSQNQPVQDLLTRRCYVTSQNHGYAVKEDALPADWEPWFVNVNDGTNEGIRSRTRPIASVQFHPEATPGPQDTAFLFDDFLRLAGSMAR
ncbi:MAG: glutamine-hydrolyzing carbamoyl-phosphate synthase small subunit [Deltaproteobacteria bacterium]|nr:glutamine-hydrolyzing carbamoyl-phosphate synthase small subunit [Deltaproteobacteria bacterium]